MTGECVAHTKPAPHTIFERAALRGRWGGRPPPCQSGIDPARRNSPTPIDPQLLPSGARVVVMEQLSPVRGSDPSLGTKRAWRIWSGAHRVATRNASTPPIAARRQVLRKG